MKIAFIGSHGVGKTTLCYELAAYLKRLDLSVDIVKEVARACPLPINRQTTVLAQEWILHSQIAIEIELAEQYEVIVCDRSVLDNYAYLVQAAGRRQDLEPLIERWMRSYDLLVKVPVVAPPTYDGTRDTSVEFQLTIDRLINELSNSFSLTSVRLATGDRSGWIAEVLRNLALPSRPSQLKLFRQ